MVVKGNLSLTAETRRLRLLGPNKNTHSTKDALSGAPSGFVWIGSHRSPARWATRPEHEAWERRLADRKASRLLPQNPETFSPDDTYFGVSFPPLLKETIE